MRRTFFFFGASLTLALAVACATAEDQTLEVFEDAGEAPSPLPDSGLADGGDPDHDGAPPVMSSCSADGWCATELPDHDLVLRDIWPFEDRAFAIAESITLGVKVLEWDAADGWRYIDDNSQNAYGSGDYAGSIWGPNENELYYGVSPAFIYHGKRAAPSAPWSWQRTRLEDNSRDIPERDHGLAEYREFRTYKPARSAALGVWGTSADDVYAWYANTVFRWKSEDGGAPGWVAEYVADDAANPSDTFFVFGATGSGKDDVWFSGGRARYSATGVFACPIVLHRTADGYARLVDATINARTDPTHHRVQVCQAKAGAMRFESAAYYPPLDLTFVTPRSNSGWLTNIESVGTNVAVGTIGNYLVYVSAEGAGAAKANNVFVGVPRFPQDVPSLLNSVWSHGPHAWISGWGLVLRADNDPGRWSTGLGVGTESELKEKQIDAGKYEVSTTVLNGAPLDVPIYRVRGTSNTNLWAVGARYALHKTTP